MQLMIFVACFISLSAGAPYPSPSFLSWFTSNSSNTLDNLYTYHSYLPESAQKFINKTIDDGKDIVYDIYDDVKEEVVSKTAGNIDSLTNVLGGMFNKFQNIKDSVNDIIMQDRALNETELTNEALNNLKNKIKNLEEIIEIDIEKDKSVTEDVEKLIQQFLSSTREMVVEMAEGGEVFWSKMKQFEVEFYKVKIALSDSTGELKEEVSELFKTMKQVDLNKIGGEEEVGQEVDSGMPRDI
eukprot:GFUD01026981.1.p1 GENE.GFUD01026981.1~~GFUD01026981.1.p1  ORF type:complete len:241 (+),score=86.26 GFUD01026981.1:145-867(+)